MAHLDLRQDSTPVEVPATSNMVCDGKGNLDLEIETWIFS
jgi:hypothetical protein